MSLITGSIKDIISIKLKDRHDSYTDQISRIFMTKIFIISSLIMSVDFFNDKVACINTPLSLLSRDFIHSACWIQGFYIYEEMKYRSEESGYYGLPTDIEMDGMTLTGKLCTLITKRYIRDPECLPMTKIFYLQYQYFPFYIASLAVLYYMPYIVFRFVNSDLISLKSNLKTKNNLCPKKIVDNYFNYSLNGGKAKLRTKISLNILIKMLYIFVNLFGFLCTNSLLNGGYKTYGIDYINWAKLNTSLHVNNYSGEKGLPKPGNVLLPVMGFCEITEGSMDVRSSINNQNKFICEISPNVLYQYVLLVLWFFFILGVVSSCAGVFFAILKYLFIIFKRFLPCKRNAQNMIYYDLTLREIEYLDYIRTKNLTVYGDVFRWLKKERPKQQDDIEVPNDQYQQT